MPDPDLPGPTSHAFMSQRLRLNYVDWGNHGAPPLLLVHGGRDHGRSWDWVAQQLRCDFHVIAPDLRGHGDSAWSPDGTYTIASHVYDLAQLIHQQQLGPVAIVAHSLGGIVSLRYAGLYPETVSRLVVIEGLGRREPGAGTGDALRREWRDWIEQRRGLAARLPRRYPDLQQALGRMQAENPSLSAEQARHLTEHGTSRNEDGTWSWKFDNYIRSRYPVDIAADELYRLWGAIACPVLLCWGRNSWMPDPTPDCARFADARVAAFDDAGHWLHHDRFDAFMDVTRRFLGQPAAA